MIYFMGQIFTKNVKHQVIYYFIQHSSLINQIRKYKFLRMYASSNHSVGIAKTSYEAQTSKYKKVLKTCN